MREQGNREFSHLLIGQKSLERYNKPPVFMVEEFLENEDSGLGESEGRNLPRTALAFATALSLFSQPPNVFGAEQAKIDAIVLADPELAAALEKKEAAAASAKKADSNAKFAGVEILKAREKLEAARNNFKKRKTPAFREAYEAAKVSLARAEEAKAHALVNLEKAEKELLRAEEEYGAIVDFKSAEAKLKAIRKPSAQPVAPVAQEVLGEIPGETAKDSRKSAIYDLGISAGTLFPLISSGDDAVQSPGVFGRADFRVDGFTRTPGSKVVVETSYVDFDQSFSGVNHTFQPRDPDERLDGSVTTFSVGAGLDVPLFATASFGTKLHFETELGVMVVHTDGAMDAAVAKKPDASGRIPLANIADFTRILPLSSAGIEIVVVTRDNISGALGVVGVLSGYPTQMSAGDPENAQVLFYSVCARASLGYKFQ